jgi:hypothetical protein
MFGAADGSLHQDLMLCHGELEPLVVGNSAMQVCLVCAITKHGMTGQDFRQLTTNAAANGGVAMAPADCQHSIDSCSSVRNGCFKCLGKHSAGQCEFFQPLFGCGICFKCSLNTESHAVRRESAADVPPLRGTELN